MYEGTCAREKASKIFFRLLIVAGNRVLLEPLSFSTAPHSRGAWPGRGSCQGSATASRRTGCGLDTSLSPRPLFSAMWGMCKCGPRRDLNAQDRDRDRRGHGRGRHGESFPVPVHAAARMNAALRSAARLAGSPQSPGRNLALFSYCVQIAVFEPARWRTAASWIYRQIHEVARGRL